MKRLIALICFFISIKIAYGQANHVRGRVIDENLNYLFGASVTNDNLKIKVTVDVLGFYTITAYVGDTLTYQFIGSDPEIRIVTNLNTHINVLLMNKTVNDLGAIWTQRQWKEAGKEIDKKYKKLFLEAKRKGEWDY